MSVSFNASSSVIGNHTVGVLDLSRGFTVKAPPEIPSPSEPPTPAEFQVSDLVVFPSTVLAGESVSVQVKASNIGEESGEYTLELELDGTIEGAKSVSLDGGDSTTVSFSVSSDEVGSHTVTIRDLSKSYEVEKVPEKLPWMYVLIALTLIMSASFFFYTRRIRV